MKWSEYEIIWKRQPLPVGVEANLTDLLATFESQRRVFYAGLRVRDFSEAGAGLFVVAFLQFLWWRLGKGGWPLSIAEVLTFGVIAFFAQERRRVAQTLSGPEVPMLRRLDIYLSELKHQRRMAQGAYLWRYLGPILAVMLIVHGTFVLRAKSWEPQRDLWFNAIFVGFYFACMALVAWINKCAIKRRLDPRIAELEKLRAGLLPPGFVATDATNA